MPQIALTITIPDEVWIGDVSHSNPDARFRILAATADEDRGVARVEILDSDADAICEDIRSFDAVDDLSVFESEPDRRRVQVDTSTPLVLAALQSAGVPLDLPCEIQAAEMRLESRLPEERLSQLGDALDAFGIDYRIEYIRQAVESESLLTDRQHRVLGEALARGYYDTPREITLVDLAEELGMAQSTCSEILHRAEGSVVRQYLQGECEHAPDMRVSAD